MARTGTNRHERILDLRDGTLRRSFGWTAPAGAAVKVRSTRLVSFVHPAVLAIRYEVVATDRPVRIRLHATDGLGGVLAHQTRRGRQRIVAAVTHLLDGPRAEVDVDTGPDLVRVAVEIRLAPGPRLRVTKLVGYAWSGHRSLDDLIAEAGTALAEVPRRGWAGLHADQRGYLDRFWDDTDVVVDGDPRLQQAVRFALLHLTVFWPRGVGHQATPSWTSATTQRAPSLRRVRAISTPVATNREPV
jgi:alpha,alpha-trehalose phosphorylase